MQFVKHSILKCNTDVIIFLCCFSVDASFLCIYLQVCHHCNKNGATAGCENKRCRRSYHYPCAIEANAEAIEERNEGSYK